MILLRSQPAQHIRCDDRSAFCAVAIGTTTVQGLPGYEHGAARRHCCLSHFFGLSGARVVIPSMTPWHYLSCAIGLGEVGGGHHHIELQELIGRPEVRRPNHVVPVQFLGGFSAVDLDDLAGVQSVLTAVGGQKMIHDTQ